MVWRFRSGGAGRKTGRGPPPTVELKGHTADLASADFSPDGAKVITASSDHSARIWDAKTGAVLATLGGHTEGVRSASFSPDGTRVVTASRDGSAKIWDANTGALLKTLSGHGGMLEYAAFSSDGSRVVTASRDKRARSGTPGDRQGGRRAARPHEPGNARRIQLRTASAS